MKKTNNNTARFIVKYNGRFREQSKYQMVYRRVRP